MGSVRVPDRRDLAGRSDAIESFRFPSPCSRSTRAPDVLDGVPSAHTFVRRPALDVSLAYFASGVLNDVLLVRAPGRTRKVCVCKGRMASRYSGNLCASAGTYWS